MEPTPEMEPAADTRKRHRARRPAYHRLDSFVRLFLGPADRSGSGSPVIHRHDAAEDESERQMAGLDIEQDSLGHHYAVRRPTDEP
jgi:hypothetical protein